MPSPLILTLALEAAAQARFDVLRTLHFPPALNYLPAHVTLFHALPGEQIDPIATALATECRRVAPQPVRATGLRSLGRGVAYTLESTALAHLRTRLAALWTPWLTPQDAQPWRPHLTIQNKVSPSEARDLLAAMQAAFTPFAFTAAGLTLSHYRNGPWEPAAQLPFTGPS